MTSKNLVSKSAVNEKNAPY